MLGAPCGNSICCCFQMIDYTGGRTLDDLIEFVEAQVEGEEEEDKEVDEEEAVKKDEL